MSSRARKIAARDPYEEISRVAIAVYAVEFKGIKALGYEPKEHTVMHDLWRSGKLEFRQQRAWHRFVTDLREMAGDSGKVSGSYAEAVQSGNCERMPVARTNREYDRVTRLCDEYLDRKKERPLLVSLMFDEVQAQGILQLTRIGFQTNGFRDKAMARASGITSICALMDRIGFFYGI